MLKIEDLNLDKLLLTVKESPEKKSGKTPSNLLFEWNKKSREELDEINETRKGDKANNQYYIKLNREYMVFDTDEEIAFVRLRDYLLKNKLYNNDAISKSFRGKVLNIPYKRHFWFKVNNQKQFKHIKEESRIIYIGGELFFGNGAFIGEWRETELNNIPEIDINIYNDLTELLNEPKPELKSKELEKIDVISSDDEEEDEPKKEIKSIKKTKINKSNNHDVNINTNKNINMDEITQLLDGLNKKRYLEYNYWLIVYFIFINEKLPLELFEEFSKKSPTYNKYENEKVLRSIKPKQGYSISTLYFWLKEDNKELFNELCKNHISFWSNDLSNYSIALLYYNMFPNDYIFSNLGWFEYNQNNVLISRGKDYPLKLLSSISSVLQELINNYMKTLLYNDAKYVEKTEFCLKFRKLTGSTNFKTGVIKELSSFYLDDEIEKKVNNINLLAFNNILYDYSKNEFRKINKEDYITFTTGYDLEYKINNNKIIPIMNEKYKQEIKNIIGSIFESKEVIKFWFYTTSISLFGNNKERFYIHTGAGGGNGKGLTQRILSNCLGKYFKQVSNNFFMGSLNKASADPELCQCLGVRYLSVSEPDDTANKKFNVSNLKTYSGNDKISCRGLFKENIEFLPQFTVNIACNEIPKMSDVDGGIIRRINIINYPFEFRDAEKINNPNIQKPINYELKEKTIHNKEFIQTFMLMLIHKAYKYGKKEFKTPESILKRNQEYINENNDLNEWFNNTLTKTNNINGISSGDLLNNYNGSEFCTKKLRPVDFKKLMGRLGIENIKKNNVVKYINIDYILNDLD